ncbi:aspartate kinase [Aneurinibacillus tyrosinisolvens]|uniref:aspartate kinase n=1 Tax=Aneurinibacillus tyrosinisolvens TaxID=1443435 RepID=UPI00063F8FF9|nr:aspartate kinase [Aneurinibacillus tyrosinisolvens]
MRILVQKFGGSSLTTPEKRERAIAHIRRELEKGYSVCVVVSAMGRSGDPYATDTLLQLIKENGDSLPNREQDMLLSCGEIISAATLASMLNAKEITATVLTGGQAGILTNDEYANAQIATINPERIVRELEKGKVVIVTGFQGRTTEWDTTTLGRGGSDTSATALGVALKAEMVDIFTDVNGIMTADPRIVEEARSLSTITYSEICNMAYQGAKVLHPRAVEIAMQTNIPIRVRSTFSDDEGTLVTSVAELNRIAGEINDRLITGIAYVSNVTQIKVMAKEGQYDLQMKVFKAMAENDISVDFINVNPIGVAYTVHDELADKAARILEGMGYEPTLTPHCAKVSTIGAGMAGVPGVMARIVEALTKEDIQILQSADSHTTIWVLVREEDMVKAVRALHRTFDLDKVQF